MFEETFTYPGQDGQFVEASFPDLDAAPAEDTEPAEDPQTGLNRGDAVSRVVSSFELRKKFGTFVRDCLQHADECFFVFSAMSHYDGIRFSPLILYPDVFPAHKDYRAINIATMLGLVHGYLDEHDSPFHPEIGMTKIQALKVVLGAADLMKWKDKFEMTEDDYPADLPFADAVLQTPEAWWYGRYLGFALDKGVIEASEAFYPDETVTSDELDSMMEKSLAAAGNEQ
jgi:hypothetical protein